MEKPKSVKIAVKLLWASLVLAMIGLVYLCSEKDVREVLLTGGTPEAATAVYFMLGAMFLMLVGCAFFIYKIDQGRNWARLIFGGLVLIGCPTTVIGLFDQTEEIVVKVIMSLQLIIQVTAVVFLMLKESADWYKQKKIKT